MPREYSESSSYYRSHEGGFRGVFRGSLTAESDKLWYTPRLEDLGVLSNANLIAIKDLEAQLSSFEARKMTTQLDPLSQTVVLCLPRFVSTLGY